MGSPDNVRRHNRSFLANAEQDAIHWILPRIPRSVTSLHLTLLGLFGSVLAGAALIGCNGSFFWLPLFVLGVVLNWFGDSFDGSLARYRKAERPRFGFLVDHTCDLFSQIVIIICFGFSPFLSLIAALVVLLCYLLFSSYTYIRAAVENVHQMAYIGLGATEFRILMVAWALLGAVVGIHESYANGPSKLDLAIAFLGALAIVGLAIKAITDARNIAAEEQEHLKQAVESRVMENPGDIAGEEVGI
ncbi:CDP-alcohol phosphatidyltransferase family protein [Methylocapsa sp. S129]|uniref:CDP-alcohol phosphatidyltransferase family protein n=1 Tax=Methylocapsa sp. S129 TaxID=1641869 RepID=UPI00131E0F38|nr:CDP-alcohol phosphatidyltransferase family protein [Methylocapsa sp. S129]